MITIIFIGIVSACLTLFLNYTIGKPGSEFSPYEIFSFYTVWLAKNRLKQIDLWNDYSEQYNDNLKRLETKAGIVKFKNDFNKMLYEAAEPFFTWERMVGMCPVCTGFWVSLITAFLFTKDFVHLVAIIVISHVTIRLINKII